MMQRINAVVIEGNKRGREIGYPTINCTYSSTQLLSGTYKVNCIVQEKLYSGVGAYFSEKSLFEVHLFDFSADIYGQTVTIIPLIKIRDNRIFTLFEDLQEQISQDCINAKNTIITVLSFGTFDHFHQGHHFYLSRAKEYGDKLVTVVARDKTVQSVKGLDATHNELTRKKAVEDAAISDIVVLGSKDDYYSCFLEWKPDVICLGYDQQSFDGGISDRYAAQQMQLPEIVRIAPYKTDKYKSSYFRT